MDRILFILPPNIVFDDFVNPPANVATVRLAGSEKRFGSLMTDVPLGVISLSAYLKAHLPVETMAVDFNVALLQEAQFEFADFASYFRARLRSDRYLGFRPTFIAISAQFTSSYDSVLRLAATCRELFPAAMVLAGGNLATAVYREFLADTRCIDAICFGEGELPMAALLRATDRWQLVAAHRSWITRGKLATANAEFQHEFIEDLDDVPPLDYEVLDLDGYRINTTLTRYSVETGGGRALPIMTSRGCPFRCTFCAAHTTHGRRMRYHSEKRVVDDIRRLIECHGIETFVVQDDHFMGDYQRAFNIVRAIRDFGAGVFFQNALAVYALDKAFLELLRSAGVDELVVSVESGSARVLKDVMRKPLRLEFVRRVVTECREVGLFTDCNIIVGMPGETKEDIAESREFLKSIYGDWFRIFVATPLPGSEMYAECVEQGYFTSAPGQANYKRAVLQTKDWTADYIQQVAYSMNIELNFVHNSNMRLGEHLKALRCFEAVLRVKPDHAIAHHFAGVCCASLGDPSGAAGHFEKAREFAERDPFWAPYVETFQIPLASSAVPPG